MPSPFDTLFAPPGGLVGAMPGPARLPAVPTFAPSAPAMAAPVAPSLPPASALPAGVPAFGASPTVAPMPSAPLPGEPSTPGFLKQTLPLAVALLIGRNNPAVIGASLAAYARGQQQAQATAEHQQDRTLSQNKDRADFYSRVLQEAQTFTDPIAFQQWKEAIAPVAQVYQIPLDGVVYSDAAKQAADRKALTAALDRAIKTHGPEVLSRPDVRIALPDGRQVSMADAQALTGGLVGADGAPVPMAPATPTPVTLARGARLVNPFTGRVIAEGTAPAGPAVGSFEDYVQRRFGDAPTAAQIVTARRAYQQADDRPASGSGLFNTSGTTPSDIDAIADAIVAGAQPPTMTGLYRNTTAVRAALARRDYNLTDATLDYQATQTHFRTLNGAQQTRIQQAIATASESLDVIDDLATQWNHARIVKDGKLIPLNKAELAAAKTGLYGQQAQAIAVQLDGQITDVVSELGNVYMGGNSPTDHALGLAEQNLRAEWSAKTLQAMTQLARTNLRIRQNSIANTRALGVNGESQYGTGTGAPNATGAASDPLGLR